MYDKYIFTKEVLNKEGKVISSVQLIVTDETTWPELMQRYVEFLRGCGFYVPTGEWESHEE